MARRRGRFSERILEKAPRKGRKKISKKKTPKVAAKPRVIEDIQIDIPDIINIPGIGQIELPKAKPKPKPKAKAKPKPKKKVKTPKKGSKAKSRPTPKPRPVISPDLLIDEGFREDLRIDPGMLEGLIQKPVKEKFKKEVEPIIGAVSDGRLDDYSPPSKPRPPVDTPKFSLPEGVLPGGKFYDDPITGDPMYQPPMPGNGIRAQVLPTPINLRTGKPVDLDISLPSNPSRSLYLSNLCLMWEENPHQIYHLRLRFL